MPLALDHRLSRRVEQTRAVAPGTGELTDPVQDEPGIATPFDQFSTWIYGAHPGLQILRDRMSELQSYEPAEDEDKPLDPRAHAAALELLRDAAPLMRSTLPKGWPMVDSEGGVRIEWRADGRDVRLVLRAQEVDSYLYVAGDGREDVIRGLTPWLLASTLDWFLAK